MGHHIEKGIHVFRLNRVVVRLGNRGTRRKPTLNSVCVGSKDTSVIAGPLRVMNGFSLHCNALLFPICTHM